jgi:AcrR family transcriptional regulator
MAQAAAEAHERPYRGVAAAERRADRRGRLLDAGLELLGTRGMSAATVTAVCELARLTPRYFYESFRDRDELLVSIFDEIVREASELVGKLLAGDGGVERGAPAGATAQVTAIVRATITAWVQIAQDDPRKARAVFVEAYGNEALMARRLDSAHRFAELLAEQARAGQHALPSAGARALDLAGLLVAGALIQTMMELLEGRFAGTPQELIDDYTRLCAASIAAAFPPGATAAGPASPAPDPSR